jgi:hypothetical protein
MKTIRHAAVLCLAALTLSTAACAHSPEPEDSKRSGFSLGLTVDTDPSARSVGLPIMPGAMRRLEKNGDKEGSGVNFSAWAGVFGLKIVVLQLSSQETPSNVADYYRRELGRYGDVIDCSANASNPGPKKAARDKDGNRLTLDCSKDGGSSSDGEYVLKAGTPKNFRLVNVDPKNGQTNINLVRIEARGD